MTRATIHVRQALIVIAAVMAASSSSAPAQTQFLIRKGKDTVAVERFTRDGPTLTGTITQSNGLRTEYVANLRADNTVEHMEMSRQGTQGPAALMSIDFVDTLVKASVTGGPQPATLSLRTMMKPLPFLQQSFALAEQIVRASHPTMGQTVRWTAVRLGAGDTASMSVARVHADSVVISVPQGDLRMAVNQAGDILGATFPPQQWVIERSKAAAKP
jgi:hypothetical protein